jgi:hypothetical protein
MRNHQDRDVRATVAFPVVGSSLGARGNDFKVWAGAIGTEPAPVEITSVETPNPGDEYGRKHVPSQKKPYPSNMVWEMQWAPREVKVIKLWYEMGVPAFLPGSNQIARGMELRYVVKTGALWKGPIGRADITIKLGTLPKPDQTSYSDGVRWSGSDTLTWHFENWMPTDDIWIRHFYWLGDPNDRRDVPYNPYHPWLPYRGDKEVYTEATIDNAATAELEAAREYFPEKAAAINGTAFRSLLADWLYHEIFARHGESFYLGDVIAGQPAPSEANIVVSGKYYGMWRHRFQPWANIRGWYRPDTSRRVPWADLPPLEKKNAEFLLRYVLKNGGEAEARAFVRSDEVLGE